jgi:hypothetical protein
MEAYSLLHGFADATSPPIISVCFLGVLRGSLVGCCQGWALPEAKRARERTRIQHK